MIYFIRMGEDGPIKIGFTATSPLQRLLPDGSMYVYYTPTHWREAPHE